MANEALVVVAQVHHGGALLQQLVEAVGVQVLAYIAGVEHFIMKSIGHQFLPHFQGQFQEALAVILNSDLEGHSAELGPRVNCLAESLEVVRGYRELGIDALVGQVDPPEHAQGLPLGVQFVPQVGRVGQAHVAVEAEGGAWEALGGQTGAKRFGTVFVA